MPAGIPATPGRLPLLEIARLRGAPEREVERVPLVRVHLDTGAGLPFVGRLGVQTRPVSREGRRIEVHTVRCDVRVALRDEPLDERDHLGNVVGGLRDHVRILDVQLPPVDHELRRVALGHRERVEPLAARAEGHLVLAPGVRVVDQVPDVGDVHHLLHPQSEVLERPAREVGGQVRIEVADVLVVVDRGPAVVDADLARP